MMTLSCGTPIALISSVQAIAAAPGAVDDHADVLEFPVGQEAGVDQAGGGDDRGAMLVVMEHRDVHPFLERLLDDEAVGRGDVLQVDPAETGAEQLDRIDEPLRVGGVDLEVDRIDVGEALEQHRLAFHHRLRRQRAEIAEAEDGGAVGNDGDEIALGGEVIGLARIGGDFFDRNGDAGRISEAEVALSRHRLGSDDLDLARPPAGVEIQRLVAREFDVALAHSLSCRGGFRLVPAPRARLASVRK